MRELRIMFFEAGFVGGVAHGSPQSISLSCYKPRAVLSSNLLHPSLRLARTSSHVRSKSVQLRAKNSKRWPTQVCQLIRPPVSIRIGSPRRGRGLLWRPTVSASCFLLCQYFSYRLQQCRWLASIHLSRLLGAERPILRQRPLQPAESRVPLRLLQASKSGYHCHPHAFLNQHVPRQSCNRRDIVEAKAGVKSKYKGRGLFSHSISFQRIST